MWISESLDALPDELRDRRPRDQEWSASEIIRHVLASDAISSPRVVQVLVRPGAPLPAFDERVWANYVSRAGTDLVESVLVFRLRREELVGILRSLDEESWRLTGNHERGGIMSVSRICRDLAEHEELHERQMSDLIEMVRLSNRPMPPA
jgi:DinB superfamily